MSRRSSAPSDEGPSHKRQKVYRACIGCVNSKTRCEDVLPARGCLRCRTKNKSCSLIESVAIPTPNGRASVDPEMEARLEAAEDGCRTLSLRVERLEQDLYHLRNMPSTSSSLPTTTAVTTPSIPTHRPVRINPLFASMHDYQRVRHDETVFNLSSQDSYPDPIARGLVNQLEMELSYHLFKHRFSLLVPLAPFLSSTSPLPAHPFVRLAILSHTSPTAALASLLEEAVLNVMAGAVNQDVMLALYILSLAPSPPDSTRAPMTPLRLISLAYSTGLGLGLDGSAVVGLKSKWLLHEAWSARLEGILLYEAVKNRYNILMIMQGRISHPIRSFVPDLPWPSASEHRRCIRHLQIENQLIDVCAPTLHDLNCAEVEMIDEIPDVERLLEPWPKLFARLDQCRTNAATTATGALLQHDAEVLKFSLAFRLSCALQRLPAPLAPNLRSNVQGFIGISLIKITRGLCERFIAISDPDLPLLPAYLTVAFVIAISVQRRCRAYMRRDGDNWNEINESVIDRAVQQMELLGGLPAKMLEMTVDPKTEAPPQVDFNAMFSDLPDDWMQAFGFTSDWLNVVDPFVGSASHSTVA